MSRILLIMSLVCALIAAFIGFGASPTHNLADALAWLGLSIAAMAASQVVET